MSHKQRYSNEPLRMWIDGESFILKNYKNIEDHNAIHKSLSEEVLKVPENHAQSFKYVTEENGKFSTSFEVARNYCTKLQDNSSLIEIVENSTETSVTFLKNEEVDRIKILSILTPGIFVARNFIHSLLGNLREKNEPMQFISIPTKSKEIEEIFLRFKNEIMNDENSIEGMHESIFQKVEKLHLTIVVFALMNDQEKSAAINALNDYKTNVLDPIISEVRPVKIKLSGVNIMRGNPAKANVLYTNAEIVDDKIKLQDIANGISKYFYEKGFVRRYENNVKLHVTLINTKYRKKSLKRNKRSKTFDSRSILNKYENFYFGICDLNSINLSLMSSVGDDGYYKSMSAINV